MPVQSDIVVKVLMQQRAELIGYAWLVVGDPDVAEDVLQDVAVLAIRKCEEINDAEHLIGWLYNAIRLRGLKVCRQQRKVKQFLSVEVLELLEHTRSELPDRTESDQMSALRECINRLGSTTRKIIELRYGQNLKPNQIAEKSGKKIQTIYKTITRAHGALRDCVRERLGLKGDTP